MTEAAKHTPLEEELLEELKGIVNFADGFVCYYRDDTLGHELRGWINGARSVIARAEATALAQARSKP